MCHNRFAEVIPEGVEHKSRKPASNPAIVRMHLHELHGFKGSLNVNASLTTSLSTVRVWHYVQHVRNP